MVDLRVSERRACRVLGQARAVQRYGPRARDDEEPLTARVVELAGTYGRYGYRRVTALLRHEGWRVNHKRTERIWRCAGLKVPRKQPRRGRMWLNDGSCVRLRPQRKDHVWAYDFVTGGTHDGRLFKMLTVVDEYTRECLAIDAARRLTSDDVLERLTWLMVTRERGTGPVSAPSSPDNPPPWERGTGPVSAPSSPDNTPPCHLYEDLPFVKRDGRECSWGAAHSSIRARAAASSRFPAHMGCIRGANQSRLPIRGSSRGLDARAAQVAPELAGSIARDARRVSTSARPGRSRRRRAAYAARDTSGPRRLR